jgi:uncharacterized protein YyaL (SSP411 family)
MRRYARTGAPAALAMVQRTLVRMARGGIHDQLGGGFHRYATDARWLVPHFEKMLYDNALLARTYLEAFQITGLALYRDVARDTLGWMEREMLLPEGGFASAQDADSEGEEGRFFVWTKADIEAVVGTNDAHLVARYYDVREGGNFEHGTSVLSVPRDPDVVAAEVGIDLAALETRLAGARAALFAARARRVAPARDDKMVVAWNALAISAFAVAARVLDDDDARRRAEDAAAFILRAAEPNGLFRTFAGGRAHGIGFLDDYAGFVAALLDLYEATFEPRWITAAQRLHEQLLDEFWDRERGGFFYTGRRHEPLLARARAPFDHATPSGNALAVGNLLRLAALTGDESLRERADRTLALFASHMRQAPAGMAAMLCGLDWAAGTTGEVVIVGQGAAARPLRRAVLDGFAPHTVVAGWPQTGPAADLALLHDRGGAEARPAVHVCRDFACQQPVHDPAEVPGAYDAAGLPRLPRAAD